MRKLYAVARRSLKISFAVVPLLMMGFALPAAAGTFSFTLSKNTASAYFPVFSGAGSWTYTYTVKGKVNSLGLNIKNHAPGAADFCSAYGARQPNGSNVVVDTEFIPAAVAQACGWQWPDPDPELWLVAYVQTGDSKASVDVTVTYPDP